jgi:hypothetical protein
MDRAEAITMLNVIATQLVGELAAEKDDKRAEYAMRMINAVDMALAALREQDATDINVGNKWISVDERLPEPQKRVLVVRNHFFDDTNSIEIDHVMSTPCEGDLWYGNLRTWKSVVTHWMPLPEPPKEGAEG